MFFFTNCVCSYRLNISLVFPTGSVIGPLLFLVSINDMPNCVKDSKFTFLQITLISHARLSPSRFLPEIIVYAHNVTHKRFYRYLDVFVHF